MDIRAAVAKPEPVMVPIRAQAALTEAMFDWIEDDDKPAGTNLKLGLHQWQVVLALYASALWRRPVELPFEPVHVETTERVEIKSYTPNRVTVDVDLASPGLLVLSDNYYRAWKVRVDGRPSELFRTNYTFRGVAIQAGRHQVDFLFSSRRLALGRIVSLATLIFLFGAVAIFVWRRDYGES